MPSRPLRRALLGYLGRGLALGVGLRTRLLVAFGRERALADLLGEGFRALVPARRLLVADLFGEGFRVLVPARRLSWALLRLLGRTFAGFIGFRFRGVGLAAARLGVFLDFPTLGAATLRFLDPVCRFGTTFATRFAACLWGCA